MQLTQPTLFLTCLKVLGFEQYCFERRKCFFFFVVVKNFQITYKGRRNVFVLQKLYRKWLDQIAHDLRGSKGRDPPFLQCLQVFFLLKKNQVFYKYIKRFCCNFLCSCQTHVKETLDKDIVSFLVRCWKSLSIHFWRTKDNWICILRFLFFFGYWK